jgi:redox-sensitive bicupin YhaK (pirin superfamily)
MSWIRCKEAECKEQGDSGALEMIIVPRTGDLGGFKVQRALPSRQRRLVGPYIFFDQMGPGEFVSGQGLDVRPHPHIGLATVTYLFNGSLDHADSLGFHKTIYPGDINLMTAGSGIVHSERTGPEVRANPSELFGLQSWLALPIEQEEKACSFKQYTKGQIPLIQEAGMEMRVLAGEFSGVHSGVQTPSPTLYLDVHLKPGGTFALPAIFEERAVYALQGSCEVRGVEYPPMQLLIFRPGEAIDISSRQGCRLVVIGGEPLEGERYIWWNFVSHSKERIEQAKEDWRAGRFDAVPGDEEEFIPLPSQAD